MIRFVAVVLSQTTFAVAAAYAVGGSISLVFQSLMFIVVYNPYEVRMSSSPTLLPACL